MRRPRTILLTLLFGLGAIVWLSVASDMAQASSFGPFDATVLEGSFEDQVVLLINQNRVKRGLLPLKRNPLLDEAARIHARAMAQRDFFAHKDPLTEEQVDARSKSAGYAYAKVGENIAAGASTPEEVVQGWLNSPGHYANIMDPDFRETGLAYVLDSGDVFPSTPGYTHYWVQTFGMRRDVFPVVIANEAYQINVPETFLSIYGEGWAQEMRIRNDDEPFREWIPFQSQVDWVLPASEGKHTVTVELRNGTEVVSASDDILLGDFDTGEKKTSDATSSTMDLFEAPPVESLALAAAIEPPVIISGQEATVTVAVTGKDAPQCMGSLGQAVDAVFVFDTSDSAGNGAEGSNWYKTVQFTQSLFGSLAQPVFSTVGSTPQQSNLALISSVSGVTGPEANVMLDLTQDYGRASELVSGITPGGDTNVADGLRLAQTLLDKASGDRPHIIFLMLHDNVPLSPAAIKAAQEVRSQGTEIYLIANTLNITSENQITPEMAREITGDEAHFLMDPDPLALRTILVNSSGGSIDAAATHVLVRARLQPTALVDIVSVGDGGVVHDNEAIWELERLNKGEAVELHYTVRARKDEAPHDLQLLVGAAYLDCNGHPHGLDIARGGELEPAPGDSTLKIGEIPTPTPTATRPPTVPVPTLVAPTGTAPAGEGGSIPTPQPMTPISLTLCPNEARLVPLSYTIPAAPQKADILLAFDVSGSMGDVLDAAANQGAELAQELRGIIPDIQLGVVIFSDYPMPPYGESGDTPYSLLQPVTSDVDQVLNTLNQLPGMLQDGGDDPEAYTRLLYEMVEDPTIGWRSSARHFVIIFGDSVGREIDPGRDGTSDTGDDIPLERTLEELEEEHITVLFVATDSGAQAVWQNLLQPIGGQAVYMEEASTLVETVQSLVSTSATHISRMTVQASPGYEDWVQSAPSELTHVTAGSTVQFEVTIQPPKDINAGDYQFNLILLGDGTSYVQLPLHIVVPESCAPPPPPSPSPPPPSPCDNWLWRWLLPLFLPLLLLLFWWIGKRYRDKRRQFPRPNTWRCWLPCLLSLLFLLGIGYLMGQRLSRNLCIVLETRKVQEAPIASAPLTPDAVGANGSHKVAVIVQGGYFVEESDNPEITLDFLNLDDITPDTLAEYDTLVLSQICNISTQPKARLQAIADWVRQGHKLIIYDSDECSQPVSYHWLPYPFTTDNPGARGSTRGQVEIVANDSMVSTDESMPSYIPEDSFAGIEVGDANVMITQDLRWCGDIEAVNDNGVRGFTHAYAFYEGGLIIYNGLDTDNLSSPGMYQLWQNELAQPWDSVQGTPQGLPCQRRVAGYVALCAPFRVLGVHIPCWLLLFPLALLLLLCWWACRPKVSVIEKGDLHEERTPPPPPPPPPPPVGEWSGPPPIWTPEKTLIIGLGGSGRWILTYIKKNLLDAGAGNLHPNVKLLLIDNALQEQIDQQVTSVSFVDVTLDEHEILALGKDFNEIIRSLARSPESYPELARWFPAQYYAQRSEVELDLRKGTGAQRPLGRAVVFDDLHQTEGSRLWQTLRDAVAAVQQGEEARIMIVGSLVGGFGSAVLADIAYLARHAAREAGAKFASIEAYLACPNTFNRVIDLGQQPHIKANAFATLLELRRLQLQSERFPYPMIYHQNRPDHPLWDGKLDRPLLDDVFLFDGYRPQLSLLTELPQHGVFPTIADAVTLHLDQASRRGPTSLWAYRRQVQGTSTDEQQRTLQAVISSLGAYTYRLPIADIVSMLQIRWAKHMVQTLILGDLDEALRLDANLNRDKQLQDLDLSQGTRFVMGRTGLPSTPPSVHILGMLLDDQQDIQHWATAAAHASLNGEETEAAQYRRYLHDALEILLNGVNVDAVVARSGKPGYALKWLEDVTARWELVAIKLNTVGGRLGKNAPANLDAWQRLCQRYKAETIQMKELLLDTIGRISRSLVETSSSEQLRAQVTPQAVYEELLALEQRWDEHRQAMARIVTRRYFVEDELLDLLYNHYLADKIAPHLQRFHWSVSEDGQMDLFFNGIHEVALRRDGPLAMAQALVQFAGFLAEPVWQQETLAQYLEVRDLSPDRIPQTVNELWAASAPLLNFDADKAPNVQIMAVLGANTTVRHLDRLVEPMIKRLPQRKQMRTLAITDPYTLILARFVDVIPAYATTPYRDGAETFMPMYGLTPRTAGRVDDASPRFVFAAENHALSYEQRLYELHIQSKIFHPLFVLALEDETKAKLYVKALAAGLVHPNYREDEREIVVERNEHDAYTLISSHEPPFSQLDLRVAAMLRFVQMPDRILNDIASYLERLPDLRQRWEEYLERSLPALYRSEHEATRDLAAFIDLVLGDLLNQGGIYDSW